MAYFAPQINNTEKHACLTASSVALFSNSLISRSSSSFQNCMS